MFVTLTWKVVQLMGGQVTSSSPPTAEKANMVILVALVRIHVFLGRWVTVVLSYLF